MSHPIALRTAHPALQAGSRFSVLALATITTLLACSQAESNPPGDELESAEAAGRSSGSHPPSEATATRLARIVREYDAQGIHRTGSEVDRLSGLWLAGQVRAAGFVPELDSFPFTRLDAVAARVEIESESEPIVIEGEVLLDARTTPPEGVSGRLVELDPEVAEPDAGAIGWSRVPPRLVAGSALRNARDSEAFAALLAVTGGPGFDAPDGLSPINADRYAAAIAGAPWGPPLLQLPSEAASALEEGTARQAHATVIVVTKRAPMTVANVVTMVAGTRSELAPVVVMTPRSGWWSCASERGGGIALWVELLHVLRDEPPERTFHFVASTGHELGHVGLDHWIGAHESLLAQAHAWIHLGANFAAAENPGVLLQASDQEYLNLANDAMTAVGVVPDSVTPIEERPLGEARNVFDGGGRYISLLGRNGLFHHPSDRWPDGVDMARLESLTAAFTEIALALSKE